MINKTRCCRDCKEIKAQEYFVKNKKFSNGYDTLCLHCNRTRVKTNRQVTKRRHGSVLKPQSSTIYRTIIINEIISRDGKICQICNKTWDGFKIHLDHIMPQALGGQHTLDNIRVTHVECNLKNAGEIRLAALGY